MFKNSDLSFYKEAIELLKMSITESSYLLKSQEKPNPDQADFDTASNSSSVSQSEETEPLGPIGFGFQQSTKALQSLVGTLNVGIFVYNKKFGKNTYLNYFFILELKLPKLTH